ncbi:MAG: DUF3160 domain-containing protein [Bacteroidota bacterium]|jgi:hypothetical protein
MKTIRASFLLMILIPPIVFAQAQQSFDISAYKQFLSQHASINSNQLLSLYSAGGFKKESPVSFLSSCYGSQIQSHYNLTDYEQSLLSKHGFVVTERLQYKNFADPLLEIYKNDLPLFFSSDALLHALHASYDNILQTVEQKIIIPKLTVLLSSLHGSIPAMESKYTSHPEMVPMLKDVDLYLTVARTLLSGSNVAPYYNDNISPSGNLFSYIDAEKPAKYPLFSTTNRTIDFSQFTPRGHYTEIAALKQYFKAMIWIGRTELYLIPPRSDDGFQPAPEDIRRQIIDAVLINELLTNTNSFSALNQIDSLIQMFAGEQDNVTVSNLQSLLSSISIDSASALLDTNVVNKFQDSLSTQSYAFQRINSQILMSDPMSPEQIRPAAAFMLLGQRFVIDSYVTGNVVYDKIIFQNNKILRMLPSTHDVLFALGNNASAQFLTNDFKQYHYEPNLAALRYLVDSYDESFWNSTLYNSWLNTIRSLNPPEDRTIYPNFMQTAAWWQEKMNTQLASWAELRHDNLLYAKQSYTGGVTCTFPATFVEPIPKFYQAIKQFAENAKEKFLPYEGTISGVVEYFTFLSAVSDTLFSIASKTLAHEQPGENEIKFGHKVLYEEGSGCMRYLDGWFPRLFYSGENALTKQDYLVADIHTAPTDALGNPVGWVFHAATGPVNMAFITTTTVDGDVVTFAGPVSSYYEYVSTNFKRLTDEEWKTMYGAAPSYRPSFVNVYLANSDGNSKGEIQSLITSISPDQKTDNVVPATPILAQNFPNPFNGSTVISFSIPPSLHGKKTELTIYNIHGQVIRRLINDPLPSGAYSARWNATSELNIPVASGLYFYRLTIGSNSLIGRMSYIK